MHQSTTGERITAALSTLAAIAILGAAVTAQQARAPQGDRLASLESDLRFQLDLAFGRDGAAHRAASGRVDEALAAWQASDQTARAQKVLAQWFHAAIADTLPGRSGKLPPTPQFSLVQTPPASPEPPVDAAAGPPSEQSSEMLATVVESATDDSSGDDASSGEATSSTPTVDAAPPETSSGRLDHIIVGVSPPQPIAPLGATPPDHDDGDETPAAEHSVAVHVAPSGSGNPTSPPLPPEADANSVADVHADDDAITSNIAPPASAAATAELPPFPPGPPAPPTIRVNLRELNARINGYHQELGEIEAATVVDGALSPEQLDALVTRLEALAGQQQFVRLYYNALSAAERRQVSEPRPMDDVIDLVSRHLNAAERGRDIFAEFDAEQSESSTLAERLAAVSEAIGVAGDR